MNNELLLTDNKYDNLINDINQYQNQYKIISDTDISFSDYNDDADDDTSIFYYPSDEYIDIAKKQCTNISKEEIKKSSRKWYNNIKNNYRLITYIKNFTHSGKDVIYIPQTNKYLLRGYDKEGVLKASYLQGLSFDHQKRILNIFQCYVSRGIDFLESIKVIKSINEPKSYMNGQPINYIPNACAIYYYVNIDNLNLVLDVYNQRKAVESSKEKQTSIKENSKTTQSKKFSFENNWKKYFNIGFHTDESLLIHSDEYTDIDEIYTALFDMYRFLNHYIELAKGINEFIKNKEELISFYPSVNITPEGSISKIGIRASSEICHYTSLEKQLKINPNYVKKPYVHYREDYLHNRFGEYEEFDVKASVPRVARAMYKFNKMYSDEELNNPDINEDIYELLFGEFVDDYNYCFDRRVKTFSESECRDYFKSMFMRLYFGGTPKQIAASIIHNEKEQLKAAIRKEEYRAKLENRPFQFVTVSMPHINMIKNKHIDLEKLIERWQYPVNDLLYKSSRKSTIVFLYESCIYLEVRAELIRRGIDVVQVYDGFYFREGTMPKDMKNIVENARRSFQKVMLDEENKREPDEDGERIITTVEIP